MFCRLAGLRAWPRSPAAPAAFLTRTAFGVPSETWFERDNWRLSGWAALTMSIPLWTYFTAMDAGPARDTGTAVADPANAQKLLDPAVLRAVSGEPRRNRQRASSAGREGRARVFRRRGRPGSENKVGLSLLRRGVAPTC